jgi:hypothetical protein
MAPSIITTKLATVKRVRNQAISPRLPKNSPTITNNATIQGKCIVSVKNPIVPKNPNPPYHPSNFWAPCGNITNHKVRRRVNPAQLSSV